MPAFVPRASFIGLAVPFALVSFVLLSPCCPRVAYDASADDGEVREMLSSVSGSAMLETVRDLQDFGSRAFCLDQSRNASEYIYHRFSDIGLNVEYQNFSFGQYSSSNVIAVIPGTRADAGVFLFGAHYDSENNDASDLSLARALSAPGADDDASGVAALIELADALRTVRVKHTLKFVAFGAEEMGFDDSGGLKGSSHFVALEKASEIQYECAVILDMIGYRDGAQNRAVVVANSEDMPFAIAASEAVSTWDLDLSLGIENAPAIRYSDHSSFWSADYPAVLVIEELSSNGYPVNPYYHSSSDTDDKLSVSQMENVTRCILAAAATTLGLHGQAGLGIVMFMAIVLVSTAAFAAIVFVWISRKSRRSE